MSDNNEQTAPYASSLEHLIDELGRVDLLVRAQVARARHAAGGEELRGLSISDDDADELLDRPIGRAAWELVPPPPAILDIDAAIEGQRAAIVARRAESFRRGTELRLAALAARFELTRFDVDALLLALAPEVDARYGKLFGYLHDDVTRNRCSVDIALSLLCPSFEARLAARRCFAQGAPLIRHGLVKLLGDSQDRDTPLIRSAIKVDNRIVQYLLGIDELDPALAARARLVTPAAQLSDLLLDDALRARLAHLVDGAGASAGPGYVVYLQGSYGVGKRSTAEALCEKLGQKLLIVDGQALSGAPDDSIAETARLVAREARLLGAALYWDGLDLAVAGEKKAAQGAILRAIEDLPGITFLGGEAPWEPGGALRGRPFLRVELPLPSRPDQVRLWEEALGDALPAIIRGDDPAGLTTLELLASRYKLSGGQIRDAAATAKNLARFHDPARAFVTIDHLAQACRIHSAPKLSALARKITVQSAWDDLVLPKDRLARLREICNQARYRGVVLDAWGFARKLSGGKGLTLLFAGPPGTGKTMAAGVMANELGLDLYAIDLSNVVNKYIGETEKHLAKIFDEAERSSAVLFFDEADALFGKRSEVRDAHDRYANIETSYLLQRMEAYEGVAILATNLAQNMDEAFVRRIQFTVDFTPPDERERLRIWERIWPDNVPRDPGVDLGFLARRFELTGGHIRNVALSAAYLAAAEGSAVTQKHLLHATRREYQKMGRIIDEKTFARS
jgi:hypothetical protein